MSGQMSGPDAPITELRDLLSNEPGLGRLLEQSLGKARESAEAGQVKESFRISGKVFMRVGLEDHEFKSSDSATSGYEFTQNRGVVTIDTAASAGGDLGTVALIPVGMAHVSSVMLTAVEGKHMAKGEEFGYFQFGGSDIIILFQQGVDPQIDTGDGFRLVGTPVAHCSHRAGRIPLA